MVNLPARRKKKFTLRLDHYLSIFFVSFIVLTLPFFFSLKKENLAPEYEYDFVQIGLVPVFNQLTDQENLSSQELINNLSSKHLLAIDVESAAVLLEKNSSGSAFPASTTKMMTALVAKEHYALDEVLTVSQGDLINGNKVGFAVGEKIKASELLHALLIDSSNEAASVLASNFPGGEREFVDRMNQKARQIHLKSTLFVNPAGFDNENIRSTPRDLGVLARELIKDEYLKNIVGMKNYSFYDESGARQHYLTNTNKLLFEDETVKGVKTGTTEGAGEVLVTLVERDGHQILIVVMGSHDRYGDTKLIIDWVFANFNWIDVDIRNLLK